MSTNIKLNFILMAGLLNFGIYTIAQTQTNNQIPENSGEIISDTLRSPYFIDDMHCAGLEFNDEANNYVSEVNRDDHKKIILQENCYQIFKSYDLEKFNWVSPDDLESFLIKIKNSNVFDNVDMNIKKSEIKNHIHIFIAVSYKKPTLDFKSQLSQSRINGKSSYDTELELKYKKTSSLTKIIEWGLKKSNLHDGYLTTNGNNETVIKEISQNTTTGYFEFAQLGFLDSRLRLNLHSRDLYTSPFEHHSKIDFEMEADFLKKISWGLAGNTYFGFAYHYFRPDTVQHFSDYLKNPEYTARPKELLAPGLKLGFKYGLPLKTYWNVDLLVLKPMTTQDSLYLKTEFDVGYELQENFWFANNLSAFLFSEDIKNYNSALHRSMLNEHHNSKIGLLFHKDIRNSQDFDRLTYGLESSVLLSNEVNINQSKKSNKLTPIAHDFLKVNYKTKINNWNLDLGLNFGI